MQPEPEIQPPLTALIPDQNPNISAESAPLSTERLAHGFKRSLFGFPPSFRRNSSQDKYGYLFPSKAISSHIAFSEENRQLLEDLGRSMIETTTTDDPAGFSTIDAGYSYFGQFVDHDLTFDVGSSTSQEQDATKLINYRTPNLDLDSVYGDGPAVSSYMYDAEGLRFLLSTHNAFDFPRNTDGVAIIGDPRNNENLIVGQIHVSLLRFHNAVLEQLRLENPTAKNDELFRLAQRQVRRHYQWIVFHDYLRTIVGADLVNDVLINGPKLLKYRKGESFVMPVEFSVAAYRFGHSMIRDHYRFNSFFSNDSFFNAFTIAKRPVDSIWNIHWPSFFGTDAQPAANKARRIDTRVALSMGNLPSAPGAPTNLFFTVLSARNLIRSMALRVPIGQYVAKRMKVVPLTADELLSSPFPAQTSDQQVQHNQTVQALQANNGLLLKQTPLWYYILKEAEIRHGGNQLGPVGGRIVVEVFMRILAENEDSFLNDNEWRPRFGAQGQDIPYRFIDLLRFAGTYPTPGVS